MRPSTLWWYISLKIGINWSKMSKIGWKTTKMLPCTSSIYLGVCQRAGHVYLALYGSFRTTLSGIIGESVGQPQQASWNDSRTTNTIWGSTQSLLSSCVVWSYFFRDDWQFVNAYDCTGSQQYRMCEQAKHQTDTYLMGQLWQPKRSHAEISQGRY